MPQHVRIQVHRDHTGAMRCELPDVWRITLISSCPVQEVEYFQKMEVADYENDVDRAEACRVDVLKLCSGVTKSALKLLFAVTLKTSSITGTRLSA